MPGGYESCFSDLRFDPVVIVDVLLEYGADEFVELEEGEGEQGFRVEGSKFLDKPSGRVERGVYHLVKKMRGLILSEIQAQSCQEW